MQNVECGIKYFREPLTIPNWSIPRKRESSNVKNLWIPAFAGMTFLSEADLKSAIPIPKPEVGGTG